MTRPDEGMTGLLVAGGLGVATIGLAGRDGLAHS